MRYLIIFMLLSINLTNGIGAELKNILPGNKEIDDWQVVDSIRTIKGNQLFDYIDGGAEIFVEYGFVQAVSATYKDNANRQLQAEVYEMADSAASYGAYSFYLNSEGQNANAGQEAQIIDYYCVVRKGNCVIVISIPQADEGLFKSIEKFASAIASKYNQTNAKPELVSKIEKASIALGHIKYIEGSVGLGNIYRFIPGSAIKFSTAVSFFIDKTKCLVFDYNTPEEANNNAAMALQKMQQSNPDVAFTKTDNGFFFTDFKNNQVKALLYKNYLTFTIGKDVEKAKIAEEKIVEVLK
ncbi:MAG TPA: hypothetical protein PK252_11050 [Bacteroidales bacterium]|nr:hypothetical protein [Bacteroidales bacterium]